MAQPDVKLMLQDGENPVEILAYHQVLVNASAVFAAMLKPSRFSEGDILQQEGMLELSLPDDDAKAMTVLCDIVHLRASKVPISTITFDLLYNLAILVDKYDFAQAVQPWPGVWLRQNNFVTEMNDISAITLEKLVKLTCVCYYFGHAEYFEKCTSCLIARSELEALCDTELAGSLDKLSSTIRDRIFLQRQECVESYYRICTDLVEVLEQGNSCKVPQSKWGCDEPTMDVQNCSSILLGNAILATREGFGPKWKDGFVWTASIIKLRSQMDAISCRLKGLPSTKYYGFMHGGNISHEDCSQSSEFAAKIRSVYERATTGLRLGDVGHEIYRNLTVDQVDNLIPLPKTNVQASDSIDLSMVVREEDRPDENSAADAVSEHDIFPSTMGRRYGSRRRLSRRRKTVHQFSPMILDDS